MLGNESLRTVDYRVDGPALYRYHSQIVERIVPWGPEAGAWRLCGSFWQPFVPGMDLGSIEQQAMETNRSRNTRGRPSRSLIWQRRVAACRFLVEHWPEQARTCVRAFPTNHWPLLQFVNAGGEPALELLGSNPALGYLAARAGTANQVGLRRRALAALVGFPETEHAVRLLRKVPLPWISDDFLGQLRTALVGGDMDDGDTDDGGDGECDADAILSHLVRINPLALEVARDPELRGRVAPDCLERLSRISARVSHCDLIARMREMVARSRDRAETPPRIRTLADLDRAVNAEGARQAGTNVQRRPQTARRVTQDVVPAARPLEMAVGEVPQSPAILPANPTVSLAAATAQMNPPRPETPQRQTRVQPRRFHTFPPPPLADVALPGFKISAIRNRDELVAEGDVMQHCVGTSGTYARRAAAGRLFFYRVLEPERLTLSIRPDASGWLIDEMHGFSNRRPSGLSRASVLDWLRRAAELPIVQAATEGVAGCNPSAPERARRPERHQLYLDFRV